MYNVYKKSRNTTEDGRIRRVLYTKKEDNMTLVQLVITLGVIAVLLLVMLVLAIVWTRR